MKVRHASRYRQWHWPVVLAGLTLFGLLAALLGGDGEGGNVWRALSWIALAVPLSVSARHMMPPTMHRRASRGDNDGF